MKKAQCKKGLDIYDRYLERMDKVQQFFKVAEKVESCFPLLVIKNQRDLSVTYANMADRILEKIKMAAKNIFLKQGKGGVYFEWNWPSDHKYDNI